MRTAFWVRIAVILGFVGLVEILCRTGVIDPFTMIPPSEMVANLAMILWSGEMNAAIALTFRNVLIAFVLAVVIGFLLGAGLFLVPRLRSVVTPLLASYYAIPIFVFYPLFVVLFGLNSAPQIMIGFLLAVVAMIINTINGFDRVPPVLLKTARMHGLDRTRAVAYVILPYALLYIFTGLKLAVSYSFIGVIAAEFILSGSGLGHEISFAYNNFDNAVMYPLILLILLVAATINMALYSWEKWIRAKQVGET